MTQTNRDSVITNWKISRRSIEPWPYQKEFLAWLGVNKNALPFTTNNLVITAGYIGFKLVGLSSLLRVMLFDKRIKVVVYWGSHELDSLIDFSMEPAMSGDGFVCRHCLRDGRDNNYPSLAAMREDHLYLPFLFWTSSVLPKAEQLEIVQFTGGATTVRLYPYSYETPSIHVDDFMSQLEMKFEMRSYRGNKVTSFYYAPLFDEPVEIEKYIL